MTHDARRTTHRHAHSTHSTRSKLKGKDAASAVVIIVTGAAAARYVFTLAKSKRLQMCHVKIVIKFELKIPRKAHGKQSNWRAGVMDRDETRRDAALMCVKEMQERSWAHTMTLVLRLGDKSDKSPTLMTIFCFLFFLSWCTSIRPGPARILAEWQSGLSK